MKVRKNMIAVMLLVCIGCSGCAKEQPKADAGNEIKSEDVRNAGMKRNQGIREALPVNRIFRKHFRRP